MTRTLVCATALAFATLTGSALAQDDPPLRLASEGADAIWMQQRTLMPAGDGVETLVWTFMREDQTADDLVWDTRLRHARVDCDARTLTYVYDGLRRRDEYLRGQRITPEIVSADPGEPEAEVVRLACHADSTGPMEFADPMEAWTWSASRFGHDLEPATSPSA